MFQLGAVHRGREQQQKKTGQPPTPQHKVRVLLVVVRRRRRRLALPPAAAAGADARGGWPCGTAGRATADMLKAPRQVQAVVSAGIMRSVQWLRTGVSRSSLFRPKRREQFLHLCGWAAAPTWPLADASPPQTPPHKQTPQHPPPTHLPAAESRQTRSRGAAHLRGSSPPAAPWLPPAAPVQTGRGGRRVWGSNLNQEAGETRRDASGQRVLPP
jgi:hypothetical protein